jgi:hypothetical protein
LLLKDSFLKLPDIRVMCFELMFIGFYIRGKKILR